MDRLKPTRGRFALLALALVWGTRAGAQELIVNGGVESYVECPTGSGALERWLDDWYSPTVGSTDYFNECGFSSRPARTGVGHCGLLAYDFSANYREYLTGTISPPLVAGRSYRLDLWVVLDAGRLHAVQEIGAWFSTTLPSWPGTGPPAGVVPHIEHAAGPIIDKVNWTLVSGTYVASGGEAFVTMGNFHDDTSTTITGWACCGQFGAYYHVDDVSLVEETVQAEPCLWRADATVISPLAPPASTLFMSPTVDGLSIAGPSWQCPMADGDVERDVNAGANGVPLSFYQVDRPVTTLRLEKVGTTLRFRF